MDILQIIVFQELFQASLHLGAENSDHNTVIGVCHKRAAQSESIIGKKIKLQNIVLFVYFICDMSEPLPESPDI